MGTAENPHAGQGMVVLDIGGDIGALIVSVPPSMDGVEIEIAPAGHRDHEPDEGGEWWIGDWHSDHHHAHHSSHDTPHEHASAWPHVAVMSRPLAGDIVHAAVYPGLRAGRYELWAIGTVEPIVTAVVEGARITEVDWPTV